MSETDIRVGDEGQRYEVICLDLDNKKVVVGWSETKSGADSFAGGIDLHPTMHSPEIIDRQVKP